MCALPAYRFAHAGYDSASTRSPHEQRDMRDSPNQSPALSEFPTTVARISGPVIGQYPVRHVAVK